MRLELIGLILLGFFLAAYGVHSYRVGRFVTYSSVRHADSFQAEESSARLYGLLTLISGVAMITTGIYALTTGFDMTTFHGVVILIIIIFPFGLASLLNSIS